MTECATRLWLELLRLARPGAGVPGVTDGELLDSVGAADGVGEAWSYLVRIGAIEHLPHDEVERLGAGLSVPGQLLAIVDGANWSFLRIIRPEELHGRLGARLTLLKKEDEPIDAIRIASQLGLSAAQLDEGLRHPLTAGQWEVMANMSEDFFPRAWSRAEASGNAATMMQLIAVLARLCEFQRRGLAETTERVRVMTEAVTFVGSVLRRPAVEGPATPRRDPIPESVRHEVWRRDQGRCMVCGSQERLEFDHIIPLARGGANTARNLQLLCEACNRAKGASI